jgi:hypothetical protein
MHYLVTVGYDTDQVDREGNFRLQKIKYVTEAESVEEATIVMNNYAAEDTRSSQILSITKMAIDNVITQKSTPEYYKRR